MTSSRLVAKSLSHPLTDPVQFDMIAQDKKVKRGKLTFILARAIGRSSLKQRQFPSKCALFSRFVGMSAAQFWHCQS
jgi:3-dehydroquinate synthetase